MGAVSQLRMGAGDDSRILTSIREGWYERQLRRTLTRDRHRHFRAEAWRISTQRAERLRHRPICRDDHVHQQMPAVRGRRDLLDEQIVHAIVGMAICERQVECPLDLSTELTRLSLSLPT
jgi:hypothetical protein